MQKAKVVNKKTGEKMTNIYSYFFLIVLTSCANTGFYIGSYDEDGTHLFCTQSISPKVIKFEREKRYSTETECEQSKVMKNFENKNSNGMLYLVAIENYKKVICEQKKYIYDSKHTIINNEEKYESKMKCEKSKTFKKETKKLNLKVVAQINNYLKKNPKYNKYKEYALNKEVKIGMSEYLLIFSKGKPTRINKTTGRWGVKKQYVYGIRNYIYVENGIVTAIQQPD